MYGQPEMYWPDPTRQGSDSGFENSVGPCWVGFKNEDSLRPECKIKILNVPEMYQMYFFQYFTTCTFS